MLSFLYEQVDDSDAGWAIQVVDRAALATDELHAFCLHALGGPFKATLVWHDYPASPAAATALVNDLSLTVRAAGQLGRVLLVRTRSPDFLIFCFVSVSLTPGSLSVATLPGWPSIASYSQCNQPRESER